MTEEDIEAVSRLQVQVQVLRSVMDWLLGALAQTSPELLDALRAKLVDEPRATASHLTPNDPAAPYLARTLEMKAQMVETLISSARGSVPPDPAGEP